MYYKVICGSLTVDVLDEIKWVRFLSKFNQVVITDKSSAHGFYGSDNKTIYKREGCKSPSSKAYKTGKLQQIGEEEYNSLRSKIKTGGKIPAERSLVQKARQAKIEELSTTCSKRIEQGVAVKLSDGKVYNFSCTLEDQLNMQALQAEILSGATEVIYHANNKPCKNFSAEDFNKILQASRKYIKYHTTYFNLLKNYVKQQQDVNLIADVYYGVDILSLDPSEETKRLMREVTNE